MRWLVPEVGSFVYASKASPMAGFAGWSMWIAELMVRGVRHRLTNYLDYYVELNPITEAAIRIASS